MRRGRWNLAHVGDIAFGVIETPGEGTPIVLVHGVGMSHRYFRRMHARLAGTRPVLSIDMPGHGDVPNPGRDLDIPRAAGGLAEVVAARVSQPAVFVGHSMGAQWIAELAVQRPELVSALVFVGPVVDDEHRTLRAQAAALGVDSLREPVRGNLQALGDYLRCGPGWYLRQARHMRDYRLEDRLASIDARMRIVRGSGDIVAGANWCARLAARSPGTRVHEIAGGGHLVHDTHAAAVVEVVAAIA